VILEGLVFNACTLFLVSFWDLALLTGLAAILSTQIENVASCKLSRILLEQGKSFHSSMLYVAFELKMYTSSLFVMKEVF
jgi:hypothetical protein